jgi:AraC-like DNA-binding protein
MIYRTLIPKPPLSQFVDHLWFYDAFFPDHQRQYVLPYGSVEWIIDLRSSPRHLFDRDDPSKSRSFRRSWISGTHSEYIIIEAAQDSSMIGVRFKPGGAVPFLDCPLNEIAENVFETESVLLRDCRTLRDELIELSTPLEKLRRLEAYLLTEAKKEWRMPRLIEAALKEFSHHPSEASIRQFAERAGISHKHLIHQFAGWVGLTPKRFCRIRRFQCALRQIQKQSAISWAGIASDCGYYDQAHFVHDFQRFSGMNPSRYLADRGEDVNFVPVRGR